MNGGLDSAEAVRRLKTEGYNELPSGGRKSIFRIAGEVMREPMFVLLIACGALYMVLGQFQEGLILVSANLMIIGITFYQYHKTERALDELKKLASPRVLVMRDGVVTRIPGREVVTGDVLVLNEGDRIAADALLLESTSLSVDESMLTGESVPVEKSFGSSELVGQADVFSGTLVVKGSGLARVTATGLNSRYGRIGKSLGEIEETRTRLQAEMKVLIRRLFLAGGILSALVIAVYIFTTGEIIRSVLNGLAAAMAILPEEFPVVLTVFLALGSWRLSRQKVLTRRPSAIETLGSATVLCSDKTGTITQNRMEVAAFYNGREMIDRMAFRSGRTDLADLAISAFYSSSRNSIDPMERAIEKVVVDIWTEARTPMVLVKNYPLSRTLLAMTFVLKDPDSGSIKAFVKGAPEAVLGLCRLSPSETDRLLGITKGMASSGYRVIAVASADCTEDSLPQEQEGFVFSFQGLIGFEDPVRPEVPAAVEECMKAGVRVIMITGDFPETARCIGAQIGLSDSGLLITGPELENLTDRQLKEQIGEVSIFARVMPEQKLRIVRALQANNEVVAMTGDGVNDAPALKAADIGIAMGGKGTDVAREAASLVLLDDNFTSIVSAIHSGRRIYDNLQKAMSYIMAIHIPIIILTLLPAAVPFFPLLLMPLHIVFMELIIDPVCSVAFESSGEERGVMSRPPRNPDERFFGGSKILWSVIEGLLLTVMVVFVCWLSIAEGHAEGEVRAITFSALIVGNLFLILSKLSVTKSFVRVIIERNVALWIIGILALSLLFLVISVERFRLVFSFEFPGYRHFIVSLSGALVLLTLLEGMKAVRFLRSRRS